MKIQIETTQNVPIEYEIGSVGDRILAYLIDLLISGGYVLLMWLLLSQSSLLDETLNIVLLSIPFLLYELVCEILLDGQTIGKKVRKLRVISLTGRQATLSAYLLRWLLRPIDIWLGQGGIALLTVILNGKGQRLGDLLANTCVISTVEEGTSTKEFFPKVEEEYSPSYPEVSALSDEDIALVKEAVYVYKQNRLGKPIQDLSTNLQTFLNIETEETPLYFLRAVIKDHHHLTSSNWQ